MTDIFTTPDCMVVTEAVSPKVPTIREVNVAIEVRWRAVQKKSGYNSDQETAGKISNSICYFNSRIYIYY
jgi:hypothetical protein